MKRSTLFNQGIFFIVLLFTAIVANAYVPASYAPFGGPRNVIQERSAIEVTQATAELLHIVIIDEDEVIVNNSTTTKEYVRISTENWEPGEYTVQTTTGDGDHQESIIIID